MKKLKFAPFFTIYSLKIDQISSSLALIFRRIFVTFKTFICILIYKRVFWYIYTLVKIFALFVFYKQKFPFFIVNDSMATSRHTKSAWWSKAARAAKFRAAKASNYPIDIVVTVQEKFFLTHKSHKSFSNNCFNHIFVFFIDCCRK